MKRSPAPRGVPWRLAQLIACQFMSGRSIAGLAWEHALPSVDIEACIRRWTVSR